VHALRDLGQRTCSHAPCSACAVIGPASAQMLRHGGEPAPPPPVTGTPVCRWSLAADRLGRGNANWRTMAVMHIAMHDALNAVEPRFARWAPATPDEAAPHGASAPVAMAAAAYQVLLARHQENAAEEADALFRAAVAAEPPGPAWTRESSLGRQLASPPWRATRHQPPYHGLS
jgi:hypothetical protein